MPTLSFATGASPKNCPCPKKIKAHIDPQTPMAVDGFCPKLLVSNSPIRKKLHPKSEETASKGGTLFLEVETPISTLHSPQASPFTGPSHICAGRVSEGYMQGFQWQSTAGRTLLAETWSEFRTLPEKLGKRMIKKCPFMKISYSMEIHWWKSQWNPMNLFSATGGLGGICEHITCAVRKNH